MSDPRRPFPPPCSSPTMHHCALPLSFVSSPPPQHHHHHQSTFLNQPDQPHAQHFTGQNLDTALDNDNWSPAQFPSMLSGYTCPQQDLDVHMSSQNPFESSLNYDSFQSEVFHYPDPQYLQTNGFYSQTAGSTADMSHWGSPEPSTPQLQCSSLGYTSQDAGPGSWSSSDYSFHSNTDGFLQFYPNSFQENPCFLSPSTPGPSPHYPQSFVTSPSADSGADRLGLFVDPGMFTVTSEIKRGQNNVIQEQTKAKKTPRARAARPRKSRATKSKEQASPVPPVPVEVGSVMPPSARRLPHDEETEEEGGVALGGAVSMDTASLGTLSSETTAPCINVGRSFQAEIPPTRHQRHANSDSHNALLLWKPSEELEQSANQERVEALLKLARSSAVPRGQASPEDVLLLLSQNRGDFLLTVENLLNKSNKKQAHGQTHLSSNSI